MSPASIASQTRYSVIILVILAGGSLMSGFFAYKIFPVSASTKIADSAFTSNSFACAVYGCVINNVVIPVITRKNAKLHLMLCFIFLSSTLPLRLRSYNYRMHLCYFTTKDMKKIDRE